MSNFPSLTPKELIKILERFPDIWEKSVSSENPKWIGIMIGATINPELMLKIRNGYYFNYEIAYSGHKRTVNPGIGGQRFRK